MGNPITLPSDDAQRAPLAAAEARARRRDERLVRQADPTNRYPEGLDVGGV